MADVSAKDGSQETMVNLAALLVNLWLLPFVDDKPTLLWLLFLLFTLLHVYSNYNVSFFFYLPFSRMTFICLSKDENHVFWGDVRLRLAVFKR